MTKILIVEDNKENRYLLETLLQAEGHQVVKAAEGGEALSLVRREPVDLVISDIMMPGMNGFRLCREMKRAKDLRRIPFIFYTATFLEKEDEILGMSLGAARFIMKPMEPARFIHQLNQVLAEQSAGKLSAPTLLTDVESVLDMYENSLTRKLAVTVEKLRKERRALQESERKLKEAQEIAQMGHWELDLQTNGLRWSDEIYRILGLRPQECQASFIAFLENVHPEDQESFEQIHRESLAKTMSFSIDFRLTLRDGTLKYVHERCQTQYDENGRPDYMAGTIQDISEQKRVDEELRCYREDLEELIRVRTLALEESNQKLSQEVDIRRQIEDELQKAKAAAEAANQAKSGFLARMSHELRSPLTAILGYSKLLQRKLEPFSPLLRYTETINSSGQHLSALINDVLEVSKIEAGYLELNRVSFDFSRLIEDVRAIVQGQAEEKGLQFSVAGAEEMPRFLLADEAKIRQILVNLLTNAIKFTDAGEITLRLECRKTPGPELVMAVEDTGVGIKAEEIGQLFQPFGQTETGRSRGGTGLGLVISRQYAQLMAGDISVRSTLAQGSVFTCTCRIEEDHRVDFREESAKIHPDISLPLDLPPKTILIADDQQEHRYFIKQLLEEVGFGTREAKDGRKALRIIDAESIDLVLMDMQMPVLDGYQTIRRLRSTAAGREIPVICISASVFEKDRDEIMAAGANSFLCKPINETELFTQIGRFLNVAYSSSDAGEDPG
jgi:PAS domain S-box-containing protein